MKKFLAMAAALTMSLSVAAASAEKYQMTFSTAVSQEQSSTFIWIRRWTSSPSAPTAT